MGNPKKAARQQGVDTNERTPWDKAVASLAGGYAAAGELAKDAVHSGLQEFVTTALGLDKGNNSPEQAAGVKEPEQQQQPQHDKDDDFDR